MSCSVLHWIGCTAILWDAVHLSSVDWPQVISVGSPCLTQTLSWSSSLSSLWSSSSCSYLNHQSFHESFYICWDRHQWYNCQRSRRGMPTLMSAATTGKTSENLRKTSTFWPQNFGHHRVRQICLISLPQTICGSSHFPKIKDSLLRKIHNPKKIMLA